MLPISQLAKHGKTARKYRRTVMLLLIGTVCCTKDTKPWARSFSQEKYMYLGGTAGALFRGVLAQLEGKFRRTVLLHLKNGILENTNSNSQ
jgi:hypothetical protein